MYEPNVLFWTLDDEPRGRQYRIRVTYEIEDVDPGDWTTPACGGAVRILSLDVVQVRLFDERGIVTGIELEAMAAKYGERAWQLLESDRRISRRLEEACVDRPDATPR